MCAKNIFDLVGNNMSNSILWSSGLVSSWAVVVNDESISSVTIPVKVERKRILTRGVSLGEYDLHDERYGDFGEPENKYISSKKKIYP